MFTHESLKEFIKINSVEGVKLCLEQGVNPDADENYAIRRSSWSGHAEIVKLLLQDARVNPSDKDNYAIRFATESRHIDVVKLLLQDARVNPAARDNEALKYAISNGHTEIIKLLESVGCTLSQKYN